MGRVLLYNFTEETRRKKVKAELFRMGLPSEEIPASAQNRILGDLLKAENGRPAAEPPGNPFREEMIVLYELTPRQFHGFLDGLKRQGIRVPLKAVVTEHNINWSSLQLRDELMKEAEAMQQGRSIHGKNG